MLLRQPFEIMTQPMPALQLMDKLVLIFSHLRQTVPGSRRVVVITNPTNPSHPLMLHILKDVAEKDGLAMDTVSVSAPADLDTAFAEMSREAPGAVIVLGDNSLFALADQIIAGALALRVPTFGNFAGLVVQAGGLLAYSRDAKESYQGVARLLKKILDGADPAELPFEQPTKFHLSVNLKTAKTLGLEIPSTLLATADEVIERSGCRCSA